MVFPQHFERHSAERLFAVDLVDHVFGEQDMVFVSTGYMIRAGPYPDTPFKRRIREAVDFLSVELRDHVSHLLQRFVNSEPSFTDVSAGPCFEAFVRRLSFRLDHAQFPFMEFLEFTTIVACMAMHLVKMGVIMAGNHAVEAIVDTVQAMKRSGRWPDWQGLEEYAGEFREKWLRQEPMADA